MTGPENRRAAGRVVHGPAIAGGRPPTMTDVAAAAGVSQTTVSLVLNEVAGARLSAETVRQVHEAAAGLGYRLVRRGSRRPPVSASTVIGFVVNEMSTDPWMAIALDGAREKAWEYGLTISVAVTRGDVEMEQAVLARMVAQPLFGLIYGTIHTQRIVPSPALHRVPTVLLNCYSTDRSLLSVVPAEVQGGRTATRALAAAGHRRIALIEGEALMDASRDRLKGYRQALASAGIEFAPDLVRPGNWEPSAGYQQTLALMKLGDPPTAIFCANDMMAVGCMQTLADAGIVVGRDVGVAGFDDIPIAHYVAPSLTTMNAGVAELGAAAAERLIAIINGEETAGGTTVLEVRLMRRESTDRRGRQPTDNQKQNIQEGIVP